MRRFTRMAVAATTVLLGTTARPASAQSASGTSTLIVGVADAETGEALEGAEVVLMRLYRIGRANGMGEATLRDVPRGTQRVRVRRLGYAPSEVDLAIVGDTTGAVFRLQRRATQLAAVNVEADWVPEKMRDVDIRRRQGIGRFLDSADLDRIQNQDFVMSVSMRFPGLRVVTDSFGNRALASTRDQLGMTGVSKCYVTLYFDDVLLPQEETYTIRLWDLAVVEFYSGSQVPARYRTKSYGCGVMLLWSKWS